MDSTGEIAELYDVSSVPTTVIIGLDGTVFLYESGAISNANIAFDFIIGDDLGDNSQRPGITAGEYQLAYARQGHPGGAGSQRRERVEELGPRGLELAARIRCPSCGEAVLGCNGKSANSIKQRLADMDLEAMSDEEVIFELFVLQEGAQ